MYQLILIVRIALNLTMSDRLINKVSKKKNISKNINNDCVNNINIKTNNNCNNKRLTDHSVEYQGS